MPAVVRGAQRGGAKARSKSSASPPSSRAGARKPERKATATVRAADGFRPSPRLVLLCAAAILVGGGALVLGTGHRGEKLVGASGTALADQSAAMGLRLTNVRLQGASGQASADILRAAGLSRG